MESLTMHDQSVTAARYREAIVRRAVDRRDQLLEVIVTNILAELPEYANGRSAADLEDIRAGVEHSIDLCLSVIDRPRSLDEEEQQSLRATGGQRARQGIPKPIVLAAVKIAVRVGRTFLMTCTDVGDDAEALMGAFREISELLDRFEDESCSCLAEGHDETWGHVLSAGDRGEAVLVDRLLERRFLMEEEVLAHAADIGLSQTREARVAVVTAAAGAGAEERLRATAGDIRQLVMSAVGPLRPVVHMHLPCVLQPRDAREWAELVDRLEQVGRRHRTAVVWSEQPVRLTALAPVYRSLREDLPFVAVARSGAGALPSLITRFHRLTWSGTPGERLDLIARILRPLDDLPER
ncbi:MAG: hypothetical protein M3394_09390, partial [Actinomycetota bacterium]|nr:hypothetical protein [Actinomycetota bacterium]